MGAGHTAAHPRGLRGHRGPAGPQGVFTVTGQGHLHLPAAVRHWCGLTAGDRVLLAANPADGLLVLHPPAALDAMVVAVHADVLGGGQA